MSSQSLAYICPKAQPPFVTGDLYLGIGDQHPSGPDTNLQTATVVAGSAVTLNAVVQPIMSQTTYLNTRVGGAGAPLLSVASPKLANPVIFFEGTRPLGYATLSANGTLASLVVNRIQPGIHSYSARYPSDLIYQDLDFGSVEVRATLAR